MSGVPASPRGSTFNGGTITGGLVVDLAADSTTRIPDGTAELSVTPAVGSLVNGKVTVYNETFTHFAQVNAGTGLNVVAGATGTLVDVENDTGGRYLLAGGATGLLIGTVHAAPTDGTLHAGECALWVDQTNGAGAVGYKGKTADGTVVASKYPLRQSSGALATVAPVSATAFQCSVTQDVTLVVPVTYNPGVATPATCKVEVSPDNVTYSTVLTITQPVGTVFDGSIEPVTLLVPAAWYVKLTATNATLGTGTYY
jgi:hypothetical protein